MASQSRQLSPTGRRPLDGGRVVVVPAGLEPELRMNVSDHEVIEEAYLLGVAEGGDRKTLRKYREHLRHYSDYLRSLRRDVYTAQRKHVVLFVGHLAEAGGENPHESRLGCQWCKERGYPDGPKGRGWSASTRKSYLSAIRFLYRHFAMEEDLPNIDPTAHVKAPKVVTTMGYTPTPDEVRKLFAAPGRPNPRLLPKWMYYAPSRRETYARTLWRDIDLDAGTWAVVGKGNKPDVFDLHPLLVRALREHKRAQARMALTNRAVRDALSDEDTAYVLVSRNGRPLDPSAITRTLKWHAIRAGVAVIPARGSHDAPGGMTSRVSPHALRRAWANHALNDPDNPVPLDVVSEVLKHADISTTRKHYAPTKPERARAALRGRML